MRVRPYLDLSEFKADAESDSIGPEVAEQVEGEVERMMRLLESSSYSLLFSLSFLYFMDRGSFIILFVLSHF